MLLDTLDMTLQRNMVRDGNGVVWNVYGVIQTCDGVFRARAKLTESLNSASSFDLF